MIFLVIFIRINEGGVDLEKSRGYIYIGGAIVLVVLFRVLQGANLEVIFSYIPSLLQVPVVIILYGFIILGVPLLVVTGVGKLKK